MSIQASTPEPSTTSQTNGNNANITKGNTTMTNETYVSPLRFITTSGMSAQELQNMIVELQNNDTPDRVNTVTMYSIFGSDNSKHTPSGITDSNLHGDGKIIPVSSVLRGVANLVGGENPKVDSAIAFANYFEYAAKSLRDSVKEMDEVRTSNEQVRLNNLEIASLQTEFKEQQAHEHSISPTALKEIEKDEGMRNELNTMKSENAELKSDHESMMAKFAKFITPKKLAPRKQALPKSQD